MGPTICDWHLKWGQSYEIEPLTYRTSANSRKLMSELLGRVELRHLVLEVLWVWVEKNSELSPPYLKRDKIFSQWNMYFLYFYYYSNCMHPLMFSIGVTLSRKFIRFYKMEVNKLLQYFLFYSLYFYYLYMEIKQQILNNTCIKKNQKNFF